MVDEAIERALRRLRIPSRNDMDRLNERIDELSARLKKQTTGTSSIKKSRKRNG
jgi:polyhydroxyalkanoate synthesis regulator phasin